MPTGLGDEELWLSPTVANNVNPFDDQSGNGNNGTGQGGIGTVADTGAGGAYAYEFDGVNDAISTPYADTGITSTGVFSYSCWVKYDSTASTTGLMCGNITTDRTCVAIYFDVSASTRGHVGLLNPDWGGVYSGFVSAGDRDTVSTGQWYHLALVGDGVDNRIYVSGAEEGSAAFGLFSSSAWDQPLQIGRYYYSFASLAGYLDGKMDDIRVYDRTLTQAEITHLATSRGVLGPPGGDNYSPFRNAKYINKTYQIPRFG